MKNITIKQFGANHLTIRDEHSVALQSYDSIVAVWDIEDQHLTLGRDWNYSTTTAKYLYRWLHEQLWWDDNLKGLADASNKTKYMMNLIDLGLVTYDGGLK